MEYLNKETFLSEKGAEYFSKNKSNIIANIITAAIKNGKKPREAVVLDIGSAAGFVAINLSESCKNIICVDKTRYYQPSLRDNVLHNKIRNIQHNTVESVEDIEKIIRNLNESYEIDAVFINRDYLPLKDVVKMSVVSGRYLSIFCDNGTEIEHTPVGLADKRNYIYKPKLDEPVVETKEEPVVATPPPIKEEPVVVNKEEAVPEYAAIKEETVKEDIKPKSKSKPKAKPKAKRKRTPKKKIQDDKKE